MNGRQKRHECASIGEVKRLESWWQLYRTSLPVRDLENFRPMDFCSTECTKENNRLTRSAVMRFSGVARNVIGTQHEVKLWDFFVRSICRLDNSVFVTSWILILPSHTSCCRFPRLKPFFFTYPRRYSSGGRSAIRAGQVSDTFFQFSILENSHLAFDEQCLAVMEVYA